uniref:FBA_2 domain-containing protein n=2 Tax=Caenorhabditis tropicalis TaxID=1561998 RepID=A0A1I7UTI4_9PELO
MIFSVLISSLSKRTRNTVKLTSAPSKISIIFSNDLFIRIGTYSNRHYWLVDSVKIYCIEGNRIKLHFLKDAVRLEYESRQEQLVLANHMLDTFKCSVVTLSFYNGMMTEEAWEFMKMIKQRRLSICSLGYHIDSESTEFIPRVLDECTEVTDTIYIKTIFPEDFFYTPPRPFKAKELRLWRTTNWFKLENSLSCHEVSIELGRSSNRTAQDYNSFLTIWMDSDAPLQKLTYHSIQEPEYRTIMNALGNQGTKRVIDVYWTEVTRRDKSEFFINACFCNAYSICIYKKQAYLEMLRKDEERALAKNLANNLRVRELQ